MAFITRNDIVLTCVPLFVYVWMECWVDGLSSAIMRDLKSRGKHAEARSWKFSVNARGRQHFIS